LSIFFPFDFLAEPLVNHLLTPVNRPTRANIPDFFREGAEPLFEEFQGGANRR